MWLHGRDDGSSGGIPSSSFGVMPLGKNSALPDNDTTTASSGCASVGPGTSHTATRSLSITGFKCRLCTALEQHGEEQQRMNHGRTPFRQNKFRCAIPVFGNLHPWSRREKRKTT